jgi:hypothetical protein
MRCGRAARAGAFLVLLVGCADGVKTADVRGKVSFDGKPIQEGAITFFPIDGKGPTAGGIIAKGEYAVQIPITQGPDGPETRRMKVSISAPKIVGMKKLYNTEKAIERPVTAESLPDRYNAKSELTIEVNPGTNERDFELKSK